MRLNSESGQMTVEMVLLAIVALTIALATSNYFRQQKVLYTLISGPWTYVKTMNEFGVWMPSREKAMIYHPNSTQRIGTPVP